MINGLLLELKLIIRNKTPRFYFLSYLLFYLIIVFFISFSADFINENKFITFLTMIAAFGGHILIYSIYSFSWENVFLGAVVFDKKYLAKIIYGKFLFNFLISSIAFLFFLIVNRTSLHTDLILVALLSYLLCALVNNVLVLISTTYTPTKINLFNNNFEIVKQPPLHMVIGVVVIVIDLSFFIAHNLLKNKGIFAFAILLLVLILLSALLTNKSYSLVRKNLKKYILK